MNYKDILKKQFNNRIDFNEKRPGITQLFAPFYYEDGDMVDIFLQKLPGPQDKIRICDYGMSIMHLSYSYSIDTPKKNEILNNIITKNSLELDQNSGNIYLDIQPEFLYQGILQFTQTVAKISSMSYFKKELIPELFYEMLSSFIDENLKPYNPIAKYYPIVDRDDLEVDYRLNAKSNKPIFLFGVKDSSKARLTTISCLEFIRNKLPFKSIIVYQNFDSLPKKDRTRLTSAADKQFPDLKDFEKNALEYLEREAS